MKQLEYALRYLERGFSVIPCKADKTPLSKTWKEFQTRLPTRAEVESWWQKHSTANIGIVTGALSNLTVVDCDSKEAWDDVQGFLPDSFTAPVVLTPSGNRQIYFKHTKGLHSQNGVKRKLDLKTDGGYVVAPPSVCEYEKSGTLIKGSHRWQAGEKCGIPAMPELLFAELEKLQVYGGGGRQNASSRTQSNNDKNIRGESERVEAQQSATDDERNKAQQSATKRNIDFNEGTRDESIFSLAWHLVKGGMDVTNIEYCLRICASQCKPPFPENELQQKIKSAIERAESKEINLTQAVRDFVSATFGNFSATNVLKAQQSATFKETPEVRHKVRTVLGRLVNQGVIERVGKIDGWYRRVENSCDDIDFMNADDKCLDLWLPFDMSKRVEIMPGNIIVLAGVPNAGKTAFLLNVARYNWDKFKLWYFSSEILGHSDIKTTMRYSHLSKAHKAQAMERMGGLTRPQTEDGQRENADRQTALSQIVPNSRFSLPAVKAANS